MGGLKTTLGINPGQTPAMRPQISTLVSLLWLEPCILSIRIFSDSALSSLIGMDQWYPTWANGSSRGMTVKSVKMWQQGACP